MVIFEKQRYEEFLGIAFRGSPEMILNQGKRKTKKVCCKDLPSLWPLSLYHVLKADK